jgi:hypothetical protein
VNHNGIAACITQNDCGGCVVVDLTDDMLCNDNEDVECGEDGRHWLWDEGSDTDW